MNVLDARYTTVVYSEQSSSALRVDSNYFSFKKRSSNIIVTIILTPTTDFCSGPPLFAFVFVS